MCVFGCLFLFVFSYKKDPHILDDVPETTCAAQHVFSSSKIVRDHPHLFETMTLPMKEGEAVEVRFVNIQHFFAHLVMHAPAFKEAVVETLKEHAKQKTTQNKIRKQHTQHKTNQQNKTQTNNKQ